MKLNQVAVQLYTVRDFCRTAEEFAVTARKIRAIGYTAVQISGVGPIPEDEIVRITKGEGLTICATHEPALTILNEPEKVIDRLHKLGCKLTAYPHPKDIDFSQRDLIDRLIRQLDDAGGKLRTAGLVLGYHNHGIEFVKSGATTVLEEIYARTKPENLVGELDTFWVHYGGGDVVEWCRRLRGRLPFIHLKDYGFTLQNRHNFCEIGAGTLPFARIIKEAEASGCRWFIVEQDTCPGDPFDSLALSYSYIKNSLVE